MRRSSRAGNHDHYRVTREALEVVRNTLSELSNVHWLHDSLVEIQGKRFLGTPLWFRDSPWNSSKASYFVCDMEYSIARTEPALWVHGHTHDSADYEFMGTRIVCNPYGYCGTALNSGFAPQKVAVVE